MPRKCIVAVVAVLATVVAAGPAVSVERDPAICASRIYDYLPKPVTAFRIDFRQTELVSNYVYDRYRSDLAAAALPFGYDEADTTFTLHETLSTFPFLNRGAVLDLIFVLCAAGQEWSNDCRRADYYLLDGRVDRPRLSLLLADTLLEPTPAPVDPCDFGKGSWSDLD
jgi:hypothetical protein